MSRVAIINGLHNFLQINTNQQTILLMLTSSSNIQSIFKSNAMQVLVSYSQSKLILQVDEMEAGQKIKIYQCVLDSLSNLQLLSSYCKSFHDFKQHLKVPDTFIFDFDNKSMIIYGRNSSKNDQCFQLASLDFQLIPQSKDQFQIDHIISTCQKNEQDLKKSQIKTFLMKIAQCIKSQVLLRKNTFKIEKSQKQQLKPPQSLNIPSDQKSFLKLLQQQLSTTKKSLQSTTSKSLGQLDRKFQKLHDTSKQQIETQLQQLRDQFDDLLKIKLQKMDENLKMSRQLQRLDKSLTKKINQVNSSLTKTLILQQDTISKLIKKIQSNYITISQQLLEYSQIQINFKKQLSRIDGVLFQNAATLLEKNSRSQNVTVNKQQSYQIKQILEKLQSKVQILQQQFETMVQLQTERLNDKLQLELHKINQMIYQIKNNQKTQFKIVQLKQKLTSIQSTQSLDADTQHGCYSQDWIDKQCFHYKNVILSGNKITAKCQSRVFGKKKIVGTCQLTVGIIKMAKWIAVSIAATQIKLKQTIDPKQPNRIVYLSHGVCWDGKEMKHDQGLGFLQGEIVTMTVDLNTGRIEWKVKDQVRHWVERPDLKDVDASWVPYICLPNQNDCVSICQTP